MRDDGAKSDRGREEEDGGNVTERGRKRRKRERGKQVAALSLPLYSPASKVDKQSDAAAMCIIFDARGLNHEESSI